MTEPFLSHLPVRVQLAALFQMLVQTGMPPLAARAVLTDWIEQGIIEVTPALPRGWRLCLLDGGGITVETATGDLDATGATSAADVRAQSRVRTQRTALAEADRLWRRAQATLDAANEKVATVAGPRSSLRVVQTALQRSHRSRRLRKPQRSRRNRLRESQPPGPRSRKRGRR